MTNPPSPQYQVSNSALNADDTIDFTELFFRLRRGIWIMIGLSLIGLGIGTIVSFMAGTKQDATTTLRVSFSFPGFERGVYPNESKFQADDIRAPDVVNEAITRLGSDRAPANLSSRVRGAIGINGFVSPTIIKERDRLRAAGQTVPAYFPDEYEITLSLPRNYPLNIQQRELLLSHLIQAYLEKFRRSYVELPAEFGNTFESLNNADYIEYELILTKEIRALALFLNQQIERAKQFRSPTTHLSFNDLLKQTDIFTQVRLNDALSLIYINGLSKDRNYALVKMDYYLRTLEDQERRLQEEAAVVTGLLDKTRERAQNYVLANRAQAVSGSQPAIDQGLIDTLLSNDAYNFLVRKALDAGLAVKRVQTDIAQLKQRRERIESFIKGATQDQAVTLATVGQTLSTLKVSYQELLARIQTTMDDYGRQEYANAARISMQPATKSLYGSVIVGALIGATVGLSLGLGYSLVAFKSMIPDRISS